MAVSGKSLLLTATLFLAIFFVVQPTLALTPLSLNADWNYNYNEDDTGSSERFSHSYRTGINHAVDLTPVMRLSTGARYSTQINEESKSDSLGANLNLFIDNYLFHSILLTSASSRISDDNPQTLSLGWQGILDSAWNYKYWPSLHADLSQGWTTDDQEPRTTDSLSTTAGLGLNWSWQQLLTTSYRGNWQTAANNLADSENTVTGHNFNLALHRGFFNNRLGLAFSQGYNTSRQEFSAISGNAGFALRPVQPAQALYGDYDPPPAGPAGAQTEDVANKFFDGKIFEGVPADLTILQVLPGLFAKKKQIVLRLDFAPIDVVYLYALGNIKDFADQLDWNLYAGNSLDEATWVDHGAILPATSASGDDWTRFDFNIDVASARYLILVADGSSLLNPGHVTSITEAEVFERIAGAGRVTASSSSTNYSSSGNVSLQIREGWRAAYAIRHSVGTSDFSPDNSQTLQTVTLGWTPPGRQYSATISASDNRSHTDTLPDEVSRSYSLSLAAVPIPTVTLGLSASRSETYEDSTLLGRTHSLSLNSRAQLYKDLNSRLTATYSNNHNELTGDEAESLAVLLGFTARLTPALTMTLTENYSQSLSVSGDKSLRSQAGLSWRLSSALYMSMSANHNWDEGEPGIWGAGTGVTFIPNQIHRFEFGYSVSVPEDGASHSFNANWSWRINRIFNLNTSGDYTISDDATSWSVNSGLRASFRGFN